jgi:threo-3-hydroxy-L-aspartate ammonia-lyase
VSSFAISFADIKEAQYRLAGVAHHTPVLTSRSADEVVQARLFFKGENFQKIGAFKFRGAFNALKQFTPEQKQAGVITFSSGNHSQAIGLAARLLNIEATILMPTDAKGAKLAATRGYGANVILFDRYTEDREIIAAKLAAEKGAAFIPPFDHPHIMAGQGTAALELFEETGELDVLIVPLGGGGLLSGSAIAAKAMSPNCTIIGVEPEAGNDGQQSLTEGKIVHIPTPQTIADGAQTQHLGTLTFPILKEYVNQIVTVTDAQIVEAMTFFFNRMKIVVEPTGAMGLAAVLSKKLDVADKKVGIIISGGNADIEHFCALTSSQPGKSR